MMTPRAPITLVVGVALMLAACGGSADPDDVAGGADAGQEPGSSSDDAGSTDPSAGDPSGDGGSAGVPGEADEPEPSQEPDAGGGGELPVDLPPPDDLGGLEPSPSAQPPRGWLLYGAWAEVEAAGRSESFGGRAASCSVLVSSDDQVIFNGSFQQNEIRNLGPHFSHTESTDVSIWGLYIGQGGGRDEDEEWIGFDGSASVQGFEGEFALIAPGGITFDPDGDGVEADGEAFLLVAEWSGSVTENFSGEQGEGSSAVGCVFVSSELLEILAGAQGG